MIRSLQKLLRSVEKSGMGCSFFLRALISPFVFFALTACKDTGGKIEGSVTSGIFDDIANNKTWSFANSGDYTYDSNYVQITGNKASLKSVNTIFNDATTFSRGTFAGTAYTGGVLKLETAFNTELSSSWTPQYTHLVGYWKMDGDWLDSSGNGYTFTPNGAGASINNTSPKVGSGRGSFDGVNTASTLSVSMDFSQGYSVFAWANPSVAGVNQEIVRKGSGTNIPFRLQLTSGGMFQCLMANSSSVALQESTALRTYTDTWTHVGCVYDPTANTLSLYVDGQFRNSTVVAISPTATTSFVIVGGSNPWTGGIDDLAIWSSPLDASQILLIYNRQKQKYAGSYESPIIDMGASGASWTSLAIVSSLPFYKELSSSSGGESSSDYVSLSGDLSNGLIALWHFDERSYNGTMNEIIDSSGHGYHATGSAGVTVTGNFGNAFTQKNTNFTLLAADAFTIPNSFTFQAWIKGTILSSNSWCSFFGKGDAGSVERVQFRAKYESKVVGLRMDSSAAANQVIYTSNDIFDGKLHHVVYTSDGINTINIYVDGKLDKTSASFDFGSGINASAKSIISGCANLGDFYLDEVAFWDHNLSLNQIQQLYRRGANRIKYQVKSCADASCNCKTLSISPAGSASDCDGDGIANSIDTSDTHAASWIGPDGTASTYFSELQNNTSVDSSGFPTGSVNITGLTLDWAGSFFTSTARPVANRYFQYRVYMESNDENNLCSGSPCVPEVTSIAIGPTGSYYGGSPTVVANAALTYSKLKTMTRSDSGSCTTYQLSDDNGSSWKWWDGSAWTSTSSGVSTSNHLSDFTSERLQTLSGGNFKFKAFLNTNTSGDFSQSCDLNSVGVSYKP
jgi:trimeric autotransporter adhesin